MLLSISSVFSFMPAQNEIPKEHHLKIVNTFVYAQELIHCRNALKPHCDVRSELIFQRPKIILEPELPCEHLEFQYLIAYINCKYWAGQMPREVPRAVMQIYKQVPNMNLFTLLISNVIHQTSGFTKLDCNWNHNEKYRSRGIIQLQGVDNYKLASENVDSDFVKHPELLAEKGLEHDAVKGSVDVWLSLVKKNGGNNLKFEKSVEMLKVWEVDNRFLEYPSAKESMANRKKIYEKVCWIFRHQLKKCKELNKSFIFEVDVKKHHKQKRGCEDEKCYACGNLQ